MNEPWLLRQIATGGVIAALRASGNAVMPDAVEALLAGGIRAVEIDLSLPGALDVLRETAGQFGERAILGAGSVFDSATAAAAAAAGARFISSAVHDSRILAACQTHAVLCLPRAYTPTEIFTASEAGAGAVILYPAAAGGPDYFRAVKDALPQVRLGAAGGVTLENAAAWLQAGAEFVIAGSELINQKLIDARDFAEITERARGFCEEVRKGREHFE